MTESRTRKHHDWFFFKRVCLWKGEYDFVMSAHNLFFYRLKSDGLLHLSVPSIKQPIAPTVLLRNGYISTTISNTHTHFQDFISLKWTGTPFEQFHFHYN